MNQRLTLILAFAVAVAACTQGQSLPEETMPTLATTTTTIVDAAAAIADFRSCMNENGVPVDELPLDASHRPRLELITPALDFSDPDTTAALSACADTLANGALDLGFNDDYRASVVEQLAAFSRCLRARGVEGFPDPAPGFIGIGSPYPAAEVPYNDPELPVAVDACEKTVFGNDRLSDS